MALNQKKIPWISENGSIFTEPTAKVKFEFTGFKEVRECVACNVGKEIAEYLVRIHNRELELNAFVDMFAPNDQVSKD